VKALALVCMLACACGDNLRGNISIDPGPWGDAIGAQVALVPYRGLSIGTGGDYAITVADDPAIPLEGYRLEPTTASSWTVHAHDVLGAQYGTAAALENLGFRFRHPFDPYVPFAPVAGTADNAVHAPQVRVRGLQVHTLHPIESYWAFWEPSLDSTYDAHRIIDWVVDNRGNYLQWVGLNDIIHDADRYAAWLPFTSELIAYAHMRGVRVGLGFELFGTGDLQQGFDLVDDSTSPAGPQIAERLALVTGAMLPFDVYALSFGEFFDSDSQLFVDSVNETAAQLRQLAPNAEMHAVVHDGGTQLVTYDGRTMIYYFLVQYCDPSIVPDIHTTFFFDLFEPVDGAYQMTDFSPHRQYLEDRMCAGQKAAYYPEDAYWVAFDDSIPQLEPLYIRSRWLDLAKLRAAGCGPLDEHLIFSSGFEWDYWLNDVTSLRASYELPGDPAQLVEDQLAPDLGYAAGKIVDEIASDQHDALLTGALAAYIASRDVAIDAGRMIGIISQPDKITFDQLVAGTDVVDFTTNVLMPLGAYADALDGRQHELDALALPDTRWARELEDGLAIDRLRARFAIATYQTVIDHLAGADTTADLQRCTDLLSQAQVVVSGRDADLHDDHGHRLFAKGGNVTEYQYGYLRNADTLCYWHRELDQVESILGESTGTLPSCLF
jgi:hypothetical protein